jgi:hypothetical protein
MFQYVFWKNPHFVVIFFPRPAAIIPVVDGRPTEHRRPVGLYARGVGGGGATGRGWPAATMGARGGTDSGVRREKAGIRWWTLKFVVSSTNLNH